MHTVTSPTAIVIERWGTKFLPWLAGPIEISTSVA